MVDNYDYYASKYICHTFRRKKSLDRFVETSYLNFFAITFSLSTFRGERDMSWKYSFDNSLE